MRLRILPAAEDDLFAIGRYIEQSNPEAAARFSARLEERCRQLAHQPHLGPARPDIAADLRFLPHRSYLIFYRIEADVVVVVRVVHGARDVAAVFREAPSAPEPP